MKKSISTRIRTTKTGKILRRPMAIGHFRAKKSGAKKQQKRKNRQIKSMDMKIFRGYH